jgi:CubicO group peptidase (beta-lactamase class C family)
MTHDGADPAIPQTPASSPDGGPELMTGFPPAPEAQVTLANWQDPPFHRWAFRHMRELIPSHRILAGPPAPLPAALSTSGAALDLGHIPVTRLDGSTSTVADVLAGTCTDAFVVLQDGHVVAERYYAGMTAGTPHLIMSVSKSVLSCVASVLADRGLLDLRAPVTTYVPEVSDSGYAGATIRDLLDMRTGVAFRETYTALDAEVRVMERSMGWRPAQPGDPAGAYPYLATLGRSGPHGGEFSYRSADTDMLGWACERVSGLRVADLISALIWRPIGAEYDAEITCDPLGTAVPDGGISATARDLARFGQLLADDGVAQGRAVVPAAWLADVRHPEPGVREAFERTDNEYVLPGGWYRSQFWVIPGPGGPVLVCLGIHGQLIYADRAARTVVVKLSSWPDAQNTAYLLDTLRSCAAIAALAHAGRAEETAPRTR